MPAIIPPAIYPAVFIDKHGSETTMIINNGNQLKMMLRGLEFVGSDFDGFDPEIGSIAARIGPFDLHPKLGILCGYVLAFDIPIPVVVDEKLTPAILRAKLELGAPTERGGIDKELLQLSLTIGSETFTSRGLEGFFEIEMLDIQKALPANTFIKSCISCAFSDYSIYGQGLFGNMLCFRNIKSLYLEVKGKTEYAHLMNECDDQVQETYLCPEFERRTPGTGYRK